MMHKIISHISLILIISISSVFANCPDDTDVCLVLDGGNLNYESTDPIAGFQFDVTGLSVSGASGGAAEAVGFDVYAGSNTVFGFSFSGGSVSSGSGVLTTLSFSDYSENACLSNTIATQPGGVGD